MAGIALCKRGIAMTGAVARRSRRLPYTEKTHIGISPSVGFWLGLGLGGTTRNRTGDTRIFSPLLYQLSYGTIDNMSCKQRVADLRVQRYDKYSYSPNLFPFFFLAPPIIDLCHLLIPLANPASSPSACRSPDQVRKQAMIILSYSAIFATLL